MERLLGRVVALLLLAGIAAAVVMGRETTPSALGHWLGPQGAAALAPGRLTLEAPIVADVLDGGARTILAADAARAADLATYLARRGTPPTDAADVRALTAGLSSFAVAARALSTCADSCRGAAIALDAQGVGVLQLVVKLRSAAYRSRL